MDTNKIAWRIYERLYEKGAGIGNASVPIIEKAMLDALKEQGSHGKCYNPSQYFHHRIWQGYDGSRLEDVAEEGVSGYLLFIPGSKDKR